MISLFALVSLSIKGLHCQLRYHDFLSIITLQNKQYIDTPKINFFKPFPSHLIY